MTLVTIDTTSGGDMTNTDSASMETEIVMDDEAAENRKPVVLERRPQGSGGDDGDERRED
jgi:hypothetical protein